MKYKIRISGSLDYFSVLMSVEAENAILAFEEAENRFHNFIESCDGHFETTIQEDK